MVIPSQIVIAVSFYKNFIHKKWGCSFKNLNVSIARILLFLWYIVTELSFSSNFWKDYDLPLYLILNALSCIRLILLLKLWHWSIETNRQYLNWDIIETFIVTILFFFFNVHERCKPSKSIKFLTCFFTEIIDKVIKFQVSVSCYSQNYLFVFDSVEEPSIRAICKSRDVKSGNGMRGMQRIRVKMQGMGWGC